MAIAQSTAPKENRSVRASNSLPSACSGDMYATVPSVMPGLVRCSSGAPSVTCEASRGSRDGVVRSELRQSKVQNLRVAPARHKQVAAGLISR